MTPEPSGTTHHSPDDSVRSTTRKSKDLTFKGSPRPTVGLELEFAVLDRDVADLVPGAPRILKMCEQEGIENVTSELMQSMLEIRSPVCESIHEMDANLIPHIRRVRNVAGSLGYDLALLGTHPFQRFNTSALTENPRYQRAASRLGWIIFHRVAFGLHIHVGVRSGDEAIAITNLLVQYLPHLLAISANSPFYQGVDTGLASSRAALYSLVLHSGVPRYFSRWRDFRKFYQVMRDCDAIKSVRSLKWDIRPRPDFGTIEFRICDAPMTVGRALSIAALTRSLVIFAQRLLDEKPSARRGDRRRQWISVENKWFATRYGLDAVYIRTPAGKRRGLRQDLAELVERLIPIARESDDHRYLQRLQPIEKLETGADRQRAVYRETGEWRAVVQDAVARLADELDGKRKPASGASAAAAQATPETSAGDAAASTGGAHPIILRPERQNV